MGLTMSQSGINSNQSIISTAAGAQSVSKKENAVVAPHPLSEDLYNGKY
jgi:hypothetical protein